MYVVGSFTVYVCKTYKRNNTRVNNTSGLLKLGLDLIFLLSRKKNRTHSNMFIRF